MTKTAASIEPEAAEQDAFCSTTTIAALLFLAAKFPHRQFNIAELCVLSGIGRTAMSQIKNAKDTLLPAPAGAALRAACGRLSRSTRLSLGKCTLQRLDVWLAKHPGFKQE